MSDIGLTARHYRTNLIVSGRGIVILGLWSTIKTILTMTIGEYSLDVESLSTEVDLDVFSVWIIYLLVSLAMALIVLALHVHVGGNAIKFGLGIPEGKKKRRFILSGAVIGLFSAIGVFSCVISFIRGTAEDTVVAAFLIDSTLLFAVCDMIYSYCRIKAIEKREKAV